MSAELLREAAAKMRERANISTSGPWVVDDPGMGRTKNIFGPPGSLPGQGRELPIAEQVFGRDAKHIASWHPAVALAVAEWLDIVADDDDECQATSSNDCYVRHCTTHRALDIARAYLGTGDA